MLLCLLLDTRPQQPLMLFHVHCVIKNFNRTGQNDTNINGLSTAVLALMVVTETKRAIEPSFLVSSTKPTVTTRLQANHA